MSASPGPVTLIAAYREVYLDTNATCSGDAWIYSTYTSAKAQDYPNRTQAWFSPTYTGFGQNIWYYAPNIPAYYGQGTDYYVAGGTAGQFDWTSYDPNLCGPYTGPSGYIFLLCHLSGEGTYLPAY